MARTRRVCFFGICFLFGHVHYHVRSSSLDFFLAKVLVILVCEGNVEGNTFTSRQGLHLELRNLRNNDTFFVILGVLNLNLAMAQLACEALELRKPISIVRNFTVSQFC